MLKACGSLNNKDIAPFVPVLVSCLARPAEVPDCVHKLAATTFVQAVEAPELSIMVPLLVRGLRERVTAIKRKSALIIDNMSKVGAVPACLCRLSLRLSTRGSSALCGNHLACRLVGIGC